MPPEAPKTVMLIAVVLLARRGRGQSARSGAGTWPRAAGIPMGWVMGSPRVLVARSAMTAAASRKTAQASRARWKPAVSAASRGACPASRALVRAVAMAEKIASPRAVPSCWEAFSMPAASPALSSVTSALAAVVTETRTAPIRIADRRRRGLVPVPYPGGGDQRSGDDHRAGAGAGEQLRGDSGGDHDAGSDRKVGRAAADGAEARDV